MTTTPRACMHCDREIRPAEPRDDYPPAVKWVHVRVDGQVNRYCPGPIDGEWHTATPREA